jgi:hypothetical protein
MMAGHTVRQQPSPVPETVYQFMSAGSRMVNPVAASVYAFLKRFRVFADIVKQATKISVGACTELIGESAGFFGSTLKVFNYRLNSTIFTDMCGKN